MTGAAIFMFVLGVGSVYSKKSDKELALYGVKLVIMELVWNLLTLALPMVAGQLLRTACGLTPDWTQTWMRLPVMVEYINVFFVAGMCYFVIVLLRKLKLPAVSVLMGDMAVLHDAEECGCGIKTPYMEILGRAGTSVTKSCATPPLDAA